MPVRWQPASPTDRCASARRCDRARARYAGSRAWSGVHSWRRLLAQRPQRACLLPLFRLSWLSPSKKRSSVVPVGSL
ncbi:Transcriptional regulator [Caballeronia sordidicola]|uniref:Transcriptional regulator n=1 Tax=Caballeronia sordidicola TaxID=196367 RepID=A0A226X745_CABSO|nr:Transcriptional regulator [Caballeronia sordidicola]